MVDIFRRSVPRIGRGSIMVDIRPWGRRGSGDVDKSHRPFFISFRVLIRGNFRLHDVLFFFSSFFVCIISLAKMRLRPCACPCDGLPSCPREIGMLRLKYMSRLVQDRIKVFLPPPFLLFLLLCPPFLADILQRIRMNEPELPRSHG